MEAAPFTSPSSTCKTSSISSSSSLISLSKISYRNHSPFKFKSRRNLSVRASNDDSGPLPLPLLSLSKNLLMPSSTETSSLCCCCFFFFMDFAVVTLLDYGAGNVRSVRNAILHLGFQIKDVLFFITYFNSILLLLHVVFFFWSIEVM
jgi:glutamine amidotransferase/cyclase